MLPAPTETMVSSMFQVQTGNGMLGTEVFEDACPIGDIKWIGSVGNVARGNIIVKLGTLADVDFGEI